MSSRVAELGKLIVFEMALSHDFWKAAWREGMDYGERRQRDEENEKGRGTRERERW